jgi:hypothetical protein
MIVQYMNPRYIHPNHHPPSLRFGHSRFHLIFLVSVVLSIGPFSEYIDDGNLRATSGAFCRAVTLRCQALVTSSTFVYRSCLLLIV